MDLKNYNSIKLMDLGLSNHNIQFIFYLIIHKFSLLILHNYQKNLTNLKMVGVYFHFIFHNHLKNL